MVAGILVGKSAPETIDRLSHWEFLSGSQVNAPIAILIWLKSISEIVIGSAVIV